ncbi:hypothetical protein M409DRAFT_71267 [Zasmidium cellare ATCC 36951]|uniref:Uncharacterized protein n=1 Tax=Zasmidium cellare ATCC 36951 TaxID=1080233 RepID=A0A6A6BWJ4_ZASCE|nr:uncharacterized protein M409DRAFT_71267 [Zasmidium cellare ATCC 36951]KAF2159147.1 hypothetical protein M409DRAFT_71267 [Zasmidium cellare ATCC 36951]
MAGQLGSYLRFLQSPSTGELASDASIHYITTTTTITEPTAILKHLSAQAKQVEKKEEKIVFTIESDNGCCVETATTLQFRLGGGAFLPGMDSNMLDEREVTFPLTHVVSYSSEGKIQQIRLYWDQGTLLKQVEAIGKTGRNWPIRDGKAQIEAVTGSIKSGGAPAAPNYGRSSGGRNPNEVVIREHSKRDSISATRDPHASLSLFAERDPNDDGRTYSGPNYARTKSAKPGPRDLGELFVDEESASVAAASSVRSPSPHKADGTILKAGAGKNFNTNRLFDDQPDASPSRSPERKKTYGQKYEHFAFGNGEDAPKENRPISNKGKSQNAATFSFEDFTTPPKHVEKMRPDYERHWGAGVDEDDPSSPPKRPIVHAARKDAAPQWDMTDESPNPTKVKSFQRQKGMGLYQDPLQDDERTANGTKSSATTSTNNTRRGDDFSAHYAMADDSPAGAKVAQNKHAARADLNANWGFGSPIQEKKIYKTAGDGMGSRKGGRTWSFGDEEKEADAAVRSTARSRAQAQAGADELEF